jgi:hypothetical protein
MRRSNWWGEAPVRGQDIGNKHGQDMGNSFEQSKGWQRTAKEHYYDVS